MRDQEFQHIPAQFWVYTMLPFVVVAITLAGIRTHNPFLFGFIGVVPFIFLLVNRIDLWFITTICVYNSSLRIPGILGQLELVHVLIAGLTGVVFLRFIIRKKGHPRHSALWKFIYMFAAVLLVTMVVRGAGFRFLGDNKWGGMRYVDLMLMLLFPFVVSHLRISSSQWKTAIVWMSILALIPFFSDLLYILSNGAVYQHFYLIKHGGVGRALQTYGSEEVATRLRSGAGAGWAMLVLPYFLFALNLRNVPKYIPFITAGFILTGLSGHRLGIINSVAFVWGYGFFINKGRRIGFVMASMLLAAMGLGLTIVLAPHLPLAIQRSISFLPFVHVDIGVAHEAAGTVSWRLQVWKNAIYEIPTFWLLGKGYAFDPTLLTSLTANNSTVDWARITVAYHSGPLSLLIGMGVLGLIAGLGVLVAAVVRHYRISVGPWCDVTLQRFHNILFVIFIIGAVRFLLLYGDVQVSFPGFFKTLALLEGLSLANLHEIRKRDEDGNEVTRGKPIRSSIVPNSRSSFPRNQGYALTPQ